MSALFGGGTVGEKKPRFTGMQVQTSSSVLPVPIGYGMGQIAPNLMWYDDFTAIKHKEKQGGKGGGVTQVSYTYTASVLMGLCEGEVSGIGRVWRDNVAVQGQNSSPPFKFNAVWVDTGTNSVKLTAKQGLKTGQGPYQLTTTGSLPGGLAPATDYWINAVDGISGIALGLIGIQTIRFAATAADAVSGPFIDLTTQGSGFNSATPQADNSFSALGFTLFSGSDPQSPWSYLVTAHPDAALAYNGIAYLAVANYDLGSSASLPNHRFEVQFPLFGTGIGGTVPDADPALMTDDFLTQARYGAGFPTDMIDYDQLLSGPNAGTTGDSTFQTYCQALGFALSPVLTDQGSAAETIDRWMEICNSAVVWTGSTLKFIPRGDQNITANGVTFLADTTPIYDLKDRDFYTASPDDDAVLFDRQDQADTYNQSRVEIANRADNYNLKPCEYKDQASIEQFGLRPDPSDFTAHEITSVDMGNVVAYLRGQRKVYIRSTCRFKLSAEYIRLEPMDVLSLTVPRQSLAGYRVRLTEVEEDDEGILSCVAEEYPIGVATPGSYIVQSTDSTVVNSQANPGPISAPIIFEPSFALAGAPQVWIVVSGADQFWGGANIWASTDGSTYSQIGSVGNGCRQGVLTAGLPSYGGSPPDAVNTLSVDISESGGSLESTTPLDAQSGVTLCYVDGELLSYTDSALTGPGQFDLTNLYRGLFGTTDATHASATDFARVDDTLFKFDLPQSYVGELIYLKFTSFNSFGLREESLADVSPYTYTPVGNAFNEQGANVTYQVVVTGFNYTIQNSTSILYLQPAATIATGTVVLPSAPVNNTQVQVFTTNDITALTVSPNAGQFTSGAPTTLLAGTNFKMVFNSTDSTWYIL